MRISEIKSTIEQYYTRLSTDRSKEIAMVGGDYLVEAKQRFYEVEDTLDNGSLAYFRLLVTEIFPETSLNPDQTAYAVEHISRLELEFAVRGVLLATKELCSSSQEYRSHEDDWESWKEPAKKRLRQLLENGEPSTLLPEAPSGPRLTTSVEDLFPEGTLWEDVEILINSNDYVTLRTNGLSKRVHYAALGFADGRNPDKPDRLWTLLIDILGKNKGVLKWSTDVDLSVKERDTIKKKISDLRTQLRTATDIQGSPIKNYSRKNGYVCKFKITDRRDGAIEDTDTEASDVDVDEHKWRELMHPDELAKYDDQIS